jgi:uncharacterized protein (TIGR02118 family)
MIKISALRTRRPDLGRPEFLDYWTQKHTPMVASLPGGATGVHKYTQLLATEDGIEGITTAPYDGVAELWVDSVEDAAAWFTGEAYNTVIAADEESFLDRTKTRFLYTVEQPIFG